MPVSPFHHVFVYGTLRRGEVRDINRLLPAPRWRGTACVPGVLYHLGAYPGVVLGGPGATGGQVHGEVYAISPELERLLDAIEEVGPQPGSEYRKRELLVQLDGTAETIACLIYELAPERILGMPIIGSGNWVAHRLAQDTGA